MVQMDYLFQREWARHLRIRCGRAHEYYLYGTPHERAVDDETPGPENIVCTFPVDHSRVRCVGLLMAGLVELYCDEMLSDEAEFGEAGSDYQQCHILSDSDESSGGDCSSPVSQMESVHKLRKLSNGDHSSALVVTLAVPVTLDIESPDEEEMDSSSSSSSAPPSPSLTEQQHLVVPTKRTCAPVEVVQKRVTIRREKNRVYARKCRQEKVDMAVRVFTIVRDMLATDMMTLHDKLNDSGLRSKLAQLQQASVRLIPDTPPYEQLHTELKTAFDCRLKGLK